MIGALILAAATATASPASAQTFAGVTLGESAAALVGQFGEPLDVVDTGQFVTYIYLARDASAMEDVMLDNGNVFSVTVWPPAGWEPPRPQGGLSAASALGVTYGGPASSVPPGKQPFTGPDGLQYEISATGDVVDLMSAQLPYAAADKLAPNPKPTLHGGTSTDDAIVMQAPNEAVGVGSEYVYLALSHCGGGGHWKPSNQSLVNLHKRAYDRLDVTCSVGSGARSFYFDITSYFGKL